MTKKLWRLVYVNAAILPQTTHDGFAPYMFMTCFGYNSSNMIKRAGVKSPHTLLKA